MRFLLFLTFCFFWPTTKYPVSPLPVKSPALKYLIKFSTVHVTFWKKIVNSKCYFRPDLSYTPHCHLLNIKRAISSPCIGSSFLSINLPGSVALPTSPFSGFLNCSWLTESFLGCLWLPGPQPWSGSSFAASSPTSIRTMAHLPGSSAPLAGWQLISCFYPA